MKEPRKLPVDVWSDIACPWCYVGKRRLESAIARFGHAGAVSVTWRSFELDPSASPEREPRASYPERLAKKYGMSVADAEARIRQLTEVAALDGLHLRFDRVRPGSTFDGHRTLHLAAARGVQGAVKERLLSAYMTEGALMADREVLARLGGEAGLDPLEVRTVLASDAYASDVRADEETARSLGIHGVPFFVIGGRYALSGAQPADVILQALNQAWTDAVAKPAGEAAEGAICGPEGCA